MPITRKHMKIGDVSITYDNINYSLKKDQKSLKKTLNNLVERINDLSKDIKCITESLESGRYKEIQFLYSFDVEKRHKATLKNLLNERGTLIDDLVSIACSCCPITMELEKLDIDAKIQGLFTHIAEKQDELMDKLNIKHDCNMKRVFDSYYDDKMVGCKIFNNATGVATDGKPFDEGIDLYTQSNRTINRTVDDFNNNTHFFNKEPTIDLTNGNIDEIGYVVRKLDVNKGGITSIEESLRGMNI